MATTLSLPFNVWSIFTFDYVVILVSILKYEFNKCKLPNINSNKLVLGNSKIELIMGNTLS